MFISGIARFFKFIVDGISSIIAFLLINLGLWLPAVFALIYIVAGAIAGVPFEGAFMSGFYAGIVIFTLVSIGLTLFFNRIRTARRQNERAQGLPAMPETKLKDGGGQPNTGQPKLPEQDGTKTIYNYNYNYYNDYRADHSDLDKKYLPGYHGRSSDAFSPAQNDQFPGYQQKSGYGEAYISDEERDLRLNPSALQGLNSKRIDIEKEEMPMIFATRANPKIFIYEYGDRLEFYKNTSRGLKYLKTEYK